MQNRKTSRWLSASVFALAATAALFLPTAVMAQDAATAGHSGSALIRHKLDTTVFDHLSFKDTDIVEVIGFLRQKTRELDPDKVGINFVVRTDITPNDHVHRAVSFDLKQVNLSQVLDAISTQTNFAYAVEDYAVYISPSVDESQDLRVRTFSVPAGFFSNVGSGSAIDVTNEMTAKGIRFPGNEADSTGK